MTESRRNPARIGRLRRAAASLALGGGLALAAWPAAGAPAMDALALPVIGEPFGARDILVDPATGVALLGYDPVAYYVDRRPRLGREDLELEWSGVVWRFVNQGNRDAFQADPEVYAPAYGGHDPMALAAGGMTEGDPKTWLIHENRLILFFSPAKRFLWLSAAEHNKATADRGWKERGH